MSHFTVLVNAQSDEDLQKILEPYFECFDEENDYTVFEDRTSEYEKEWAEKEVSVWHHPDNPEVYRWEWDKTFRVPDDTVFGGYREDPAVFGWVLVKAPVNKVYKNIGEFVKDYHGDDGVLINGEMRYGAYHNPNAQWDWWVVGGRWDGVLKTKDGNNVSQCKLEELDTEGMRKQRAKNRVDDFDEAVLALKPFNMTPNEAFLILKEQGGDFENKIEPTPAYIELRKALSYEVTYSLSEIRDKTREQVYDEGYNDALTFALLDKDGWLQSGQMGWWAIVTDENEGYVNLFWERVSKWNSGNVYVVDCHI